MFMQLIAKLFKRAPAATVDRTIQLQEQEPMENWEPIKEIIHSVPHVVHFECAGELIERGYWSSCRPRRIRRINLEPQIAARPGAAAKVNRLVRRGFYQSLRRAA